MTVQQRLGDNERLDCGPGFKYMPRGKVVRGMPGIGLVWIEARSGGNCQNFTGLDVDDHCTGRICPMLTDGLYKGLVNHLLYARIDAQKNIFAVPDALFITDGFDNPSHVVLDDVADSVLTLEPRIVCQLNALESLVVDIRKSNQVGH